MSTPNTSHNSPPSVLIVDDDEEIRFIVGDVLGASGFKTIMAARADEAMRMIEEMAPDVVITDALMPGGDGRELCRRVKTTPGLARTKVIVMTSLYKLPHYKYEAYKQFKADEYLLKPVDFPQLLHTLNRLVGRRPPMTQPAP